MIIRGDIPFEAPRVTDVDMTTTDRGIAMFCDLPAAERLTVGYPVDSTGLYPLHTFKLGTQQNQVARIRASPP